MKSKTEKKWNLRFNQLKKYYLKYGHCDIHARHKRNKALGTWVVRQRVVKDKLTADQVEKLDSIEFVWNPRKERWDNHYQELIEYYEKYGDYKIPVVYEENRALGRWVQKQRRMKHELPKIKFQKLEEINFLWDPTAHDWYEFLDELKAFKDKFGHVIPVPKTHKRLYNWLSQQKRKYRYGKLEEEYSSSLRKLGVFLETEAEYLERKNKRKRKV